MRNHSFYFIRLGGSNFNGRNSTPSKMESSNRNGQELLERAKTAITSLSDSTQTANANEWLVDFERSFAAWQVADRLVREETGQFRFFGAKFLYSKISRQYFQLEEGAITSLTQTLVQLILQFGQDPSVDFVVCRYLCLALAVLVLQMNKSGIISQVLQWLNPIITTNPKVLLELLIVLPEESFNRQVDIDTKTRNMFIKQLSASSADVLTFLSSLWTHCTEDAQSKILKCVEKWIDITEVAPAVIVVLPIYSYMLQTLATKDGELFEYAVDAVGTILQRFRTRDTRILHTVIPVVMNLRAKWQQQVQELQAEYSRNLTESAHKGGPGTSQEEGDDLDGELLSNCRVLSRLFSELAEACLDLFLSTSVHSLGQGEMAAQLLECARFPFDHNVSRIPLKFFYELAMMVKKSPQMSEADNAAAATATATATATTAQINGTVPSGNGTTNSSSSSSSSNSNNNSQHNNGAGVGDDEDDDEDDIRRRDGELSKSERRALNSRYQPLFESLMDMGISHMVLPARLLIGAKRKLPEIVADVRSDWRETVLDCCYVLGGPHAMMRLCTALQTELQLIQQQQSQESSGSSCSGNSSGSSGGVSPPSNPSSAGLASYGRVESLLLGMQVAVPFLSRTDTQFIPEVLSFTLSPALQATGWDSVPLLRSTVIELFGRCGFWLEQKPDFAVAVLQRLFQDLSTPATCTPAAKATMNVFRNCSRMPNLPIQELHNVVLQLRAANHAAMQAVTAGSAAASIPSNGGSSINSIGGSAMEQHISLHSELLLLEALAVAATNLHGPEREAAFKSFVSPIATELNHFLQAPPSELDTRLLAPYVDRLTALFQFFRCSERFVAEVFVSVLPLFQRIFAVCPTERMCEKSCRCYKHAMRSTGKAFLQFVPDMAQHLTEQFGKSPFPAFLYGGSTCISTFALVDAGICVPALYQMLWGMSTTFFAHFPSLQHFEQKPDVVEEYFFLVAKALQYCPGPFVQAPAEAAAVIQAGLSGLALHHREAQKGILLFFERFVQLVTFWQQQAGQQADANAAVLGSAAQQLVEQHAPAVATAVFSLLSGDMPAYALDESNGCISDVLWCLQKRFTDQFKVGSVHMVGENELFISCGVM